MLRIEPAALCCSPPPPLPCMTHVTAHFNDDTTAHVIPDALLSNLSLSQLLSSAHFLDPHSFWWQDNGRKKKNRCVPSLKSSDTISLEYPHPAKNRWRDPILSTRSIDNNSRHYNNNNNSNNTNYTTTTNIYKKIPTVSTMTTKANTRIIIIVTCMRRPNGKMWLDLNPKPPV